MKNLKIFSLLFLIACLVFTGCVKKIIIKKVSGALTAESSGVFTSDDDPQLIADALPFALKTYESLLATKPNNIKLLITTGKAFCTYAYAFVYAPADTISDVRITEKNLHYQRAKKLFLRSKSYLLRAFEILHPQTTFLLQTDKTDSVLSMVTPADTSLLFWTASAWMGAFMCDKFDMSLAVDIPKPVAFMHKLLAMNETFGNGSVHDFFISYYGGMPQSMGGSEEKARQHFRRSVELSQGWAASPYVALASTLCVAKQDIKEFKTLMQQALAIDVDKNISNRLANIISQNKARWMLDHRDNYFLDSEPAGGEKQ